MEKSGRGLTAHPLLNSLGLAGMCMCFVQFSKEQIMKSLKRSKELDFDNRSSDPQFTRGLCMYIVPWIAGVDALAMLASKFMNLQMIDFFFSCNRYNKACSDACESREEKYYWCNVGSSWDYCSPPGNNFLSSWTLFVFFSLGPVHT